jgi:hypothetical protein
VEKVINTALNHVAHHLPFVVEKRKALNVAS